LIAEHASGPVAYEHCENQLKELVSEQLNERTCLDDLLRGLTKYCNAEDLIVAVHLNRDLPGFRFERPLELGLRLGGLYSN